MGEREDTYSGANLQIDRELLMKWKGELGLGGGGRDQISSAYS